VPRRWFDSTLAASFRGWMDVAKLLSLLAERARELREAGLLSLQTSEFTAVFAPFEAQATAELQSPNEGEITDPLLDPATFPGGRRPQFFRRVNE
jgi:hypothetical protein